MSDIGIKISQPGHDVKTAPKENLVFSSKYDTLKLFKSGSGSQNVPARVGTTSGKNTVTIPHNLGYIPAFTCFVSSIHRTTSDLSPYAYRSVGSTLNIPNYSIDTVNLYINLYNSFNTIKTVIYRYHIYYNELL